MEDEAAEGQEEEKEAEEEACSTVHTKNGCSG